MKKLFAIVDTGEMKGDCSFYCPDSNVPYKKGMKLKDIREAYFQKLMGEGWDEEKGCREVADSINIAWIVDAKIMNALNNAGVDYYNDGQVYTQNSVMKSMAESLAIMTIK